MPWPMDVPKGRRIISDIESNGLLPGMSDDHPPMDRVHCATAEDIDTGESIQWTPDTIKHYPEWMMDEVGVVIGHNFLSFDNEAIKFVYPSYDASKFLTLDTLILCKMIWPADSLIGPDMALFHKGKMPGKYLKRQSLGAWGYRLGNYKGEYDGGWLEWSPDMHAYMIQDGKVNVDLWRLIERKLGWNTLERQSASSGLPGHSPTPSTATSNTASASAPNVYVWPFKPIQIEHDYERINREQEAVGVYFDSTKAAALSADLENRKEAMSARLKDIFGSWYAPKDDPHRGRVSKKDRTRICKEHPDVTLRRFSEKTGKELAPYVGPPKETTFANAPYCRIEYTEFNPSSRDHLGDRLRRVFGWVPNIYTTNGKPQVDEGAIKAIPASVIDDATRAVILDYFVLTKTLGQLSRGAKCWMDYVKEDGAIHGRVDPLGTISSRAAHFNPNLGQVPSVTIKEIKDASGAIVEKKVVLGIAGGFGHECRELFRARPKGATEHQLEDWELTGVDMSSLEFIWMGHYLHPLDEGVFSERVCDPTRDPHTEHGELTGLPRRDTKAVSYSYIYGAGKWNIGMQVGVEEDEIPALLKDKSMLATLRWMQRSQGRDYKEPSDLDKARIAKGSFVIKKFEAAITGLKFLKEDITESAKRGWIKAIDGRKLVIRKPHAALNTLLQGAGAIACKVWIIIFHQKMRALGHLPRRDYNQVLWVHDEIQVEHRPGLGPIIKQVANEAAQEAGVYLGLRGRLRTEGKSGTNWAETH